MSTNPATWPTPGAGSSSMRVAAGGPPSVTTGEMSIGGLN